MDLTCKQCGAALSDSPERGEGDWYLPCLACGAKNILAHMLMIVGWR